MSQGMSEQLESFVLNTIKNIVDIPQEVKVYSTVSTKTITLNVKVEQSDCGKIIGRKGRTIDALKVLTLAIKNTNFPDDSRKVSIEVLEDETSSFNK